MGQGYRSKTAVKPIAEWPERCTPCDDSTPAAYQHSTLKPIITETPKPVIFPTENHGALKEER